MSDFCCFGWNWLSKMDSGTDQNQSKSEQNVIGAQPDIKDIGDVANFVSKQ